MNINKCGYWEGTDVVEHHYFDQSLYNSLLSFCKEHKIRSIIDLGCGKGDYIKELCKAGFFTHGVDGNPDTKEITNGHGEVIELHKDILPYFKDDWDLVLSLEVGEHIPEEYEDIFINNITSLVKEGGVLIVSWAIPGQGGNGHVNCQTNEYIIDEIESKGLFFSDFYTAYFRENIQYSWFKETLMIFIK